MNKFTYQGFQALVNSDGKPFPDYRSADGIRDQLHEIAPEYGFSVQELPEGGFIVVQSLVVKLEKTAPSSAQNPSKIPGFSNTLKISPEIRRFAESLPLVFRPAWRNYLLRWGLVFLFVVMAFSISALIKQWLPMDWLTLIYQKIPYFNKLVAGFFWFIAIYHTAYIFQERYSNTYTVTKDGLKSKAGIIARDAHSIKFRDIRGVVLKQDVLDRLLGVGTIDFHTAGTDKAEVTFFRIAHPAYLRDVLDGYAAAFRQNQD